MFLRKWYLILGSCILLMPEVSYTPTPKADCFMRAEYDKQLYYQELYDLKYGKQSIFDFWYYELYTGYNYDDLLSYIPLMFENSLVLGGTCEQVHFWLRLLPPSFKLSFIEKDVYDRVYDRTWGKLKQ